MLLTPEPFISALHNPIPMCSHDDVECDRGDGCARCGCTSWSVIVLRDGEDYEPYRVLHECVVQRQIWIGKCEERILRESVQNAGDVDP